MGIPLQMGLPFPLTVTRICGRPNENVAYETMLGLNLFQKSCNFGLIPTRGENGFSFNRLE
jgi:hypothetical protein